MGRLFTDKYRSVRGASHLLDYMGGCLAICESCLPCPPNGRVSHCFIFPLMIGLIVVLLTFFVGVMSMVLLLWELVLFYGMDVELQGRNFPELLQENEMAPGCHCRN